ncbi:hypothetical protein GPN2_20850 [Streptomyces murinus]
MTARHPLVGDTATHVSRQPGACVRAPATDSFHAFRTHIYRACIYADIRELSTGASRIRSPAGMGLVSIHKSVRGPDQGGAWYNSALGREVPHPVPAGRRRDRRGGQGGLQVRHRREGRQRRARAAVLRCRAQG